MTEILCTKCNDYIRFNRTFNNFVNLKGEHVKTGAEATGIEFTFKCKVCDLEYTKIVELKNNDYGLSSFLIDINTSIKEYWGIEKITELYFDLMENAENLRKGKAVN